MLKGMSRRRLGARDHKTGSAFRFEIAARPISRGSVWSRFADCTELITQKLAGKERLAIDLLHDSHAARIIASARDALTRAETIPAIRLLESQAALAYWSAMARSARHVSEERPSACARSLAHIRPAEC
jgi:hypothetical protein